MCVWGGEGGELRSISCEASASRLQAKKYAMEQSIKSVLVKQTLNQQQQFASLQVTHTLTHTHTNARSAAELTLSCSASDGVSDHGLWGRSLAPAVGA